MTDQCHELVEKYFRYYEINIYELKSFKMFLKLLEQGKINILLKYG